MSATIAQIGSRLDALLELASPENRYTDLAIQFEVWERGPDGKAAPTGQESTTYGGVWDLLGRRYDETRQPKKVARYKVSAKQLEILEAAASGRYHHLLVLGARRSSKSELLALWVILRAVMLPGVPINLAFVKLKKAVKWAREKLWPRITELVAPGLAGRRKSLHDFGFTFANGTPIGIITAEVVDDPRGDGVGSVGCDERQIVGKELMDNLMLSLSEAGDDYQTLENGTALQGDFQDYFEEVSQDGDYFVITLTSLDNPFIGQAFILDAKKHMDPRRYAQEVLAQFAPQSAVVYHQYERAVHRRAFADAKRVLAEHYGIYEGMGKDITADVGRVWFGQATDFGFIHGMDFNVSPMVAIVYRMLRGPAGVGDIWWATDEVVLQDHADATQMAKELRARGFHPAGIIPDASGRHSEGGISSHRMLRDGGFQVVAPNRNPSVADRVNSVNTLLRNVKGHVRLFVDSKCTSLLKCLENHKNGTDGKPEKDKIHEHRGDAMGYPIALICPATVDFAAERRTARERMAAFG